MGVVTKRNEVCDVKVSDTKGNHTIPLSVTRVERSELLSVENPNYKELTQRYPHLRGVRVEDTDSKSQHPVHVILGARDYAPEQ